MFRLCDRISAFAYGEAELETEDDCCVPSKATLITFRTIDAAHKWRSVALHRE